MFANWVRRSKKKYFCVAPFTQYHVSLSGEVFPCCTSSQGVALSLYEGQSASAILNSEPFARLRRDMLSGKPRPDLCKICYYQEKYGRSIRQERNELFRDQLPALIENVDTQGKLKQPHLLTWDVRFSNLCNFRCRTCGPESSRAWATELARSDPTLQYYEEEKFAAFRENIPFVQEAYFAGGEPLLARKHYELLEALISAGRTDVRLRYNTNMSTLSLGNWDVIDLWRHFPRIAIGSSLDEVGPRAEYVRKGTHWQTVTANMQRVKQALPWVVFKPNVTFSVFNALRAAEILETLWSEGLIAPLDSFMVGIVDHPAPFHVACLPLEKRLPALEKLRTLRARMQDRGVLLPQLDLLEGVMQESDRAADQTRNMILGIDRKRQENIRETLPDVAEALGL